MKKLFLALIILIGLLITGVVYAAPKDTYQVNLLPLANDTYNLGSSTPLDEWNNIFTKNITITGTCTGCSGTSPFTPQSWGNSTTSVLGMAGFIVTGSSTMSYLGTGNVYAQNGNILSVATTSSSQAFGAVYRDSNQNAFAQNFVSASTVFPSLGTTNTLTAASPRTWIITGTKVQTLKLPVGTTLSNGASYVLNNNSTGNASTTDNGGNLISFVLPGGTATSILYDNSTINGLWDAHSYLGHQVYSGNNNLSIGTTSPFATLSIHANPNDATLYNTLFAIGSSTATATTTLFSIDNQGNVNLGIGNFQMGGTNRISSGRFLAAAGTAASPSLTFSSGATTGFFYDGSNGIGITTNGAQVGEINSSGNFGIGTTSPFADLSVMAGNNYAAQALSTVFAIGSSTAGLATTTLFSVNSAGITTSLGTINANAGVNVVGSVSQILTANSTGVVTRNSTTGTGIQLGNSANNGFWQSLGFFTARGSTATLAERMHIDNWGNVGIGTTSPFAQLSIATMPDATGATTTLFAIASSTRGTATTTLFSVGNTGSIFTTLADGCVQAASGFLTSTGVACGSGGGAAFPFTPTTNFGVNTNATSTIINFTVGIQASSTSNINALNLGSSTPQAFTNAPLVISGNNNSYTQAILQNLNGGTTASADFIVGGNLMTNSSYYGDLGYNSSGNTDANFTGFAANDLYLYNNDASLDLAAASSTNTGAGINFFTGGTLTANKRLSISSTGVLTIATTTAGCLNTTTGGIVFAATCSTGTVTSVTATYPILSTGGNTPVISTAFGTTSTWGMGNNGLVMTGATGIPFTTATTSPSFQLATYASTTQLSSGTNTFYINGSGTVNTKDVTTGYTGITSPVSGLSMQTGTTTGWTASTSAPYIPSSVAPFAGTIKDIKCATDASFLGIEVDINSTAIAPSYFVASTTKGIITATGSNTFSYGDVISFKAGTTTTATATNVTCTIRTVQTS